MLSVECPNFAGKWVWTGTSKSFGKGCFVRVWDRGVVSFS